MIKTYIYRVSYRVYNPDDCEYCEEFYKSRDSARARIIELVEMAGIVSKQIDGITLKEFEVKE